MEFQTQLNVQTQSSAPLPLGQAIRELPGQYIKVLTRPTVKTFEEEKGKASWGINWIQFIALSIIGAILQSLGLLISPPALGNMASTAGMSSTAVLTTIIIFLAVVEIIATPISFLAAGGILFIIARVFGGKGTFREQIYTTLLFGVPLVIASYLLFLIPVAGAWLLYLPHIYSLVLLFISFQAVHQFRRNKI